MTFSLQNPRKIPGKIHAALNEESAQVERDQRSEVPTTAGNPLQT
jgi:hypothetical protein